MILHCVAESENCFKSMYENSVMNTRNTIVRWICVKYHKDCGLCGKSTKIGIDHAEYI